MRDPKLAHILGCFVVLLFCCLLQLCPILAYFFFLIEALIELRKML